MCNAPAALEGWEVEVPVLDEGPDIYFVKFLRNINSGCAYLQHSRTEFPDLEWARNLGRASLRSEIWVTYKNPSEWRHAFRTKISIIIGRLVQGSPCFWVIGLLLVPSINVKVGEEIKLRIIVGTHCMGGGIDIGNCKRWGRVST